MIIVERSKFVVHMLKKLPVDLGLDTPIHLDCKVQKLALEKITD